jgi:P2 family phage contractile tail tube protein
MAIKVHSVTNANIYIGANSHLGEAKEVQIPELSYKMVDHEALGMIGMTELWAGFDKMEATIQWNSIYPEAIKGVSDPNQAVILQVRSSVRVETSTGVIEEQPFKAFLTTRAKNLPGYNFKQQQNVETESKMNVTAIKVEVDGDVLYDIDLLANVAIIDGVDILAQYRRNLGI